MRYHVSVPTASGTRSFTFVHSSSKDWEAELTSAMSCTNGSDLLLFEPLYASSNMTRIWKRPKEHLDRKAKGRSQQRHALCNDCDAIRTTSSYNALVPAQLGLVRRKCEADWRRQERLRPSTLVLKRTTCRWLEDVYVLMVLSKNLFQCTLPHWAMQPRPKSISVTPSDHVIFNRLIAEQNSVVREYTIWRWFGELLSNLCETGIVESKSVARADIDSLCAEDSCVDLDRKRWRQS